MRAGARPIERRGPVVREVAPRVRLRGIVKTFGSVEALRGVDLWPGACLGLLGDAAAGKSTLTEIVSGTHIPDGGSMEIDGAPTRLSGPAAARAAGIEMVFQDLSLCDHVDAAGNLLLGREPTRGPFLDRRRMLRDARATLDDPRIRIPRLSAKVARLSGGQRQSIAIARAAASDPRVLIMDEPTPAPAVAEVDAVLALIDRLKARGVCVVLITHRLQDLFRACDRIAVTCEGTLVAERAMGETSPEELVRLIVGERMHWAIPSGARAAPRPTGSPRTRRCCPSRPSSRRAR